MPRAESESVEDTDHQSPPKAQTDGSFIDTCMSTASQRLKLALSQSKWLITSFSQSSGRLSHVSVLSFKRCTLLLQRTRDQFLEAISGDRVTTACNIGPREPMTLASEVIFPYVNKPPHRNTHT